MSYGHIFYYFQAYEFISNLIFPRSMIPEYAFVDNSSEEKTNIEDDFMYGNNVASSHVYIRLGN